MRALASADQGLRCTSVKPCSLRQRPGERAALPRRARAGTCHGTDSARDGGRGSPVPSFSRSVAARPTRGHGLSTVTERRRIGTAPSARDVTPHEPTNALRVVKPRRRSESAKRNPETNALAQPVREHLRPTTIRRAAARLTALRSLEPSSSRTDLLHHLLDLLRVSQVCHTFTVAVSRQTCN